MACRQPIFDTYREGSDEYRKEVRLDDHTFSLSKNGLAVGLEEWNRAVNRMFPMVIKEKHPLALVRMKEKWRRRFLASLVRSTRPRVAADVGSEGGHVAGMILDDVELLYCIDIDSRMVDASLRTLNSPKAVGVVSSAEKLELNDACIDTLLAASVLEHVSDPRRALGEFRRTVRRGGFVIISVPNDLAILQVKAGLRALGMTSILGKLASGLAMGHIHVFSLGTFRRLAATAGEVTRCGFIPPAMLDMVAVIRV
jgi:ubiquinone/menaquinone biosynthesis C-methylase UbiE